MKIKFKDKIVPINNKVHVNNYFDDFVVVDSKMNEAHLKELQGIKVICTLPSVDTRVCSLELSKFINLLNSKNIQLISISMDLPFALERWCQNHSENLIAASDFRYHDFKELTGLFMEEIGLFARSVMILDENNIVKYIEVVENTSNEPNYQQVLNYLKA